MRSLLFIALLALPSVALPQTESTPVVLGHRFVLESQVMDEGRPYLVSLPPNYDNARFSKVRYPVLYVLDGSSHFRSASGAVDFMSRNHMIPEMIVVAVPNTNRMRDLSPVFGPHDVFDNLTDRYQDSGGGDRFLSFLTTELAPAIDARYRTLPWRMLVGHSLGGLFVMHTFLNHRDAYQGYVAVDPSLWFAHRTIEQQTRARIDEVFEEESQLYMSIGEVNPCCPRHGEAMHAYRDLLAEANPTAIRWKVQEFPRGTHNSIHLSSLVEALDFFLGGPDISVDIFYEDPDMIEPYYQRLSDRLGVSIPPPEPLLNQLGHWGIGGPQVERGVRFLEISARLFPDSPNAFDSLADGYQAVGDDARAREYREKACSLAIERQSELRDGICGRN